MVDDDKNGIPDYIQRPEKTETEVYKKGTNYVNDNFSHLCFHHE